MNICWFPVVFALVLGLSAEANAQVPDEDSLYDQGAELRTQHRDAEALDLFRQIHARAGHPRALAQMSLAEGAIGRWVDAEVHLAEALTAGADPWVQRNREALNSAQHTIREHLGSLDVHSTTVGAELWIQGRRAASLPMTQPVRVVAGTVAFEVRAAGHITVLRVATVASDGFSREDVDLAPTALPVAAATREVISSLTAAPPIARATLGQPTSVQRTLGWVAAAGAGAFFTGGVVAYVIGRGEVSSYDLLCPPPNAANLSSDCRDRVSSVATLDALTITGLVGGGALSVTSVLLLLTAPSHRFERSATGVVVCGPGPGDLGMTCRSAF